jgi:hypothetical protein
MKRILSLALILGLVTGLFAEVTLISQRGSELIIGYTLDSWNITTEGSFSRITAEGMDYSSVSGAPLIPYDEFKIGLPPYGTYTYSIMESSTKSVELPSKLLPVPAISVKDGLSDYIYEADISKYLPSRKQIVEPLDAAGFRGYTIVPFKINPFSYDGDKTVQVTTGIKIRIEITGNLGYRSGEASDTASNVILGQVVNKDQAKNWRNQTRETVNYAPFGNSDYWMRIETNRDGMYKITPSQISSFPLQDIDPRQFRMFSTTGRVLSDTVVQSGPEFREIPILVSGEADGSFDANDYIMFYGSSRDSYEQNSYVQTDPVYFNPYSQNQVFWLSFGQNFPGTALRINQGSPETNYLQSVASTPATKHVESESQRRDDTGFTWFGARWFGNSTSEYQMQTELTDVDTASPQNLSFRIRKEEVSSDELHRINVEVNGTLLISNPETGSPDFTWAGTGFYTFSKSIDNLISGTNTIKIKVIRSSTDNLFFDWYNLSYNQLLVKGSAQKLVNHPATSTGRAYRFNVTGGVTNVQVFRSNSLYEVEQIPLQGQMFVSTGVTSSKYFLLSPGEAYSPSLIEAVIPADLTANTAQVDNIIITPAEFADQSQALAQKYFDLYGIRSRVILQEDIFNQFNGGHPDPVAIRQAMRYFYYNLPSPHVSSLTLMGLGTIDWRNFSGSSLPKNKIIVWQDDYFSSDDYFGMISNSFYPELAIGRYPVKNQNELNTMLQNFSNYTQNPTPGWWRNSMVFIGDDLNNGSSTYEYIHTQQTEEAGNIVNPSIQADKIFALEYEYDEFQNKPKAREDMFAAINEGRLLWCYIGHGSFDKLGAEDYLNGATDMGKFQNTGKLPFFIASSCKVSHFDYWGYESLGQKTVLLNNVGAIASYAARRISYPDNNQPMLRYLLISLANNRNPLGLAVMDAKVRYTENNNNDAVYVLLGDPIIRVLPPERDSTMQVTGQDSKAILHSRETAIIDGTFSVPQLSGEAEVKVFGTDKSYYLGPGTLVSHRGNQLYRGSSEVNSSAYSAGFVVPDDVISGNDGLAVSYIWDSNTGKDYTNYYAPLQLSDQAIAADNPDVPQIEIYLGSYDFRPGDTVSSSPTLYAKISDSNGINITGASGHNIFLIIDNSLQPIAVTQYFSYDQGSYTAGTLTYALSNLSEGLHSIQLIAFDNFNQPSVATTQFVSKQSTALSLERLLIYPNPISTEGYITFILSSDAELNIGVYTIRGKRIRSIKTNGRQGFNSIPFNGRDDKGSSLANNTYFVKVKAVDAEGKSVEKTEKLVIYK